MSIIVTRTGKGAALTHAEMDANFSNLNTDKYEAGSNASLGTLVTSGQTDLGGSSGAHSCRVPQVALAVNYVQLTGGTTGSGVTVGAQGANANIDLLLAPKGSGNVRFGSWSSNADAPVNGYITVKDAAGTTRKLATIA